MELSFKGKEAIIQQDFVTTEDGGRIPVELYAVKDNETDDNASYYEARIDGVTWYKADNVTHAVILYKLLRDHVTEYMHYTTTK